MSSATAADGSPSASGVDLGGAVVIPGLFIRLIDASVLCMEAQRMGTTKFPLAVAKDGIHFEDAAGTPFLWMGDTSWPLLSS